MLDFKPVTLDDIEKIKGYFGYSANRICDNTVGGMFMWRENFSMEYALFNDTLITKIEVRHYDSKTAFSLPLGKDRQGALTEVEEYCRYSGLPLVYCLVTKDELPVLSSVYDNTELHWNPDWSDYLYRASDLVTLTGRKYHGQRNHINFFNRTYGSYSFEEIQSGNLSELKEFYGNIYLKTTKDSEFFVEEQNNTREVLDKYDAYGLIGGLIRVNGSIAAFSIGEILHDTLFVHIEKTDSGYRGVQQVINNEFAGHFAGEGIEFINRCEDDGDEGLRMAKQSYHPCGLIDKYIVRVV